MAKKQPRKFWKAIKRKYRTKSKQSEILTADDLLNHFKTVFGDDTTNNADVPQNPPPQQNQQSPQPEPQNVSQSELDAEISETELRNAIFHQKNNKSPGIDNLNSELFKISFDIISPYLLKLYNRLFSNGEYPTAWGEGIIVPIFKSGNIDEPQNYRGITLINILAKIYSQILLNRISKWSENENKLSQTSLASRRAYQQLIAFLLYFP